MTLMLAGRYDEAESELRKALEIQIARNDDAPIRLAVAQVDLGNLLRLRRNPDTAIALLKPAAAAFEAPTLSGSPSRPMALAGLSEAQLDAGDPDAALASAQAAMASARANIPPGHYLVGTPLYSLARVELALGHPERAEPLLLESLKLRQSNHPNDDPRVLEVQVALIAALHATQRDEEATKLRVEVEPQLRALRSPYAADLRARLSAGVSRT